MAPRSPRAQLLHMVEPNLATLEATHPRLRAQSGRVTIGRAVPTAEADEPPWIPAGTALGKYAVVGRVGVGGLAEVYEAIHLALRKRVALKVMRQDLLLYPEAGVRFVREGENASLVKHPNVVDVYDVGEFQGVPFLVMEYLEGTPLSGMLPAGRQLTLDSVANLMLPIIAGVRAIHQANLVHRDLKPANVFVERAGRRVTPKVLDFGLSRSIQGADRITQPGLAIGTPHYMAPEQARGETQVGPEADQYSMGVMLYEMLTGCLPHQGLNGVKLLHAVAYEGFDSPRLWRPDLPEELEQVLLTAMAHQPEARFGSLGKLARAILPFASERAQTYWGAEFDEQATAPPISVRQEDLGRGKLELPRAELASLWDDGDDDVTDITQLLPELPPELRQVMTRWEQARTERSTPERERAVALASQVRGACDTSRQAEALVSEPSQPGGAEEAADPSPASSRGAYLRLGIGLGVLIGLSLCVMLTILALR
ncbi:MAG: serine/threonine-protein kinase [Polyangiaceae bacterium]